MRRSQKVSSEKIIMHYVQLTYFSFCFRTSVPSEPKQTLIKSSHYHFFMPIFPGFPDLQSLFLAHKASFPVVNYCGNNMFLWLRPWYSELVADKQPLPLATPGAPAPRRGVVCQVTGEVVIRAVQRPLLPIPNGGHTYGLFSCVAGVGYKD